MAQLPRPIAGRRKGRRTTTTALVFARVPSWPGYTFDVLIRPGDVRLPFSWATHLPREFTVHGIDGRLDVVHEWSRQ